MQIPVFKNVCSKLLLKFSNKLLFRRSQLKKLKWCFVIKCYNIILLFWLFIFIKHLFFWCICINLWPVEYVCGWKYYFTKFLIENFLLLSYWLLNFHGYGTYNFCIIIKTLRYDFHNMMTKFWNLMKLILLIILIVLYKFFNISNNKWYSLK